MESYERDRPATDIEQDLGGPGASVEAAGTATPDLGSGAFGVMDPGATEGASTDVEQDTPYSDGSAATDPTLR